MTEELSLDIEATESPEPTVITAFPGPGMAGISATRYLEEQIGLEEMGHIQAEGLPAVTPYLDGRPYHHTRLFSKDDFAYTLLTSELPIPLQFTEPFGRKLLSWIDERAVEEVTLLTAIPSLNDADQDLFYVASDDYRAHRLADIPVNPLAGGFLSGVNASLIARAMDTSLRVGVLATGVNPQQPFDGSAALRLVEGLDEIYDFDVETDELRAFADSTEAYLEQLTAQIEAQQRTADRRTATEDYGFM